MVGESWDLLVRNCEDGIVLEFLRGFEDVKVYLGIEMKDKKFSYEFSLNIWHFIKGFGF